ncbi:MAG: class I SAM-dependent methyltransferase [Caldilineaceae bacterium]
MNTASTNPEPTTDDTWAAYYQKVAGRPPRPLFMKAMSYYAAATNADLTGRAALDLGCGDGTETLALLHHGWQVWALDQHADAIARVEAHTPADQRQRLTTRCCLMEEAVFPQVDLVYAGLSLPFCTPAAFPVVWQKLVAALPVGGRFAGHLFGDRDAWAGPDLTFQTIAEARALFAGFAIEAFVEFEEDAPTALQGMKHWHLFEVIARKL